MAQSVHATRVRCPRADRLVLTLVVSTSPGSLPGKGLSRPWRVAEQKPLAMVLPLPLRHRPCPSLPMPPLRGRTLARDWLRACKARPEAFHGSPPWHDNAPNARKRVMRLPGVRLA